MKKGSKQAWSQVRCLEVKTSDSKWLWNKKLLKLTVLLLTGALLPQSTSCISQAPAPRSSWFFSIEAIHECLHVCAPRSGMFTELFIISFHPVQTHGAFLEARQLQERFQTRGIKLAMHWVLLSKVIQERAVVIHQTQHVFKTQSSLFSPTCFFLGGREEFLFHPYFTFYRSYTIDFLMSNNCKSATNKFELFFIFLFTTFHNYINQCSLH